MHLTWGIPDVKLTTMNYATDLNQSVKDLINLSMIDLGYTPGEAYEYAQNTDVLELIETGEFTLPEVDDDIDYNLIDAGF